MLSVPEQKAFRIACWLWPAPLRTRGYNSRAVYEIYRQSVRNVLVVKGGSYITRPYSTPRISYRGDYCRGLWQIWHFDNS